MRKINKIIVHCTATNPNVFYDVEDINRWHIARGFRSCGYHYVILLDGRVQIGRPLSEIGAHCKGYNKGSIGICLVGGLDSSGNPANTYNFNQLNSLYVLIKDLMVKFKGATLHPHFEFANKACPCFDVVKWFQEYEKSN